MSESKGLDLSVGRAKAAEAKADRFDLETSYGAVIHANAGSGNEFIAKRDRMERMIRRRDNIKQRDELNTTQSIEAIRKAYAGTYVTGWSRVQDGDTPVQFTDENFNFVCDLYPGLFSEITAAVTEREEANNDALKARSGN